MYDEVVAPLKGVPAGIKPNPVGYRFLASCKFDGVHIAELDGTNFDRVNIEELAFRAGDQPDTITVPEAHWLAAAVGIEISKFEALSAYEQTRLQAICPERQSLYLLDVQLDHTLGARGLAGFNRRYAALASFRRQLANRISLAEAIREASLISALRGYVNIGDLLEAGLNALKKVGVKPEHCPFTSYLEYEGAYHGSRHISAALFQAEKSAKAAGSAK